MIDLAAQKDEEVKIALRSIVRAMVQRATSPFPFRRLVSLAQLERLFTVLHTDMVRSLAEEQLGVQSSSGLYNLLRLRNFFIIESSELNMDSF